MLPDIRNLVKGLQKHQSGHADLFYQQQKDIAKATHRNVIAIKGYKNTVNIQEACQKGAKEYLTDLIKTPVKEKEWTIGKIIKILPKLGLTTEELFEIAKCVKKNITDRIIV